MLRHMQSTAKARARKTDGDARASQLNAERDSLISELQMFREHANTSAAEVRRHLVDARGCHIPGRTDSRSGCFAIAAQREHTAASNETRHAALRSELQTIRTQVCARRPVTAGCVSTPADAHGMLVCVSIILS